MEFRILGSLEVVQDGEPCSLGAMQQRALLAVLVLHRGEPVSIDRLIDELWGERAPATAAKTVQVYVSQLRKALGAGVIVTQGRGYRLAVAPEQVDAGRFELLCVEGRRALSDGDTTRAAEHFAAALGLWRGEPLSDFAYEPFAQGAIGRLQEARLAALEYRIDADLASGRDGDLIPEIESLVASNPMQERLRAQLMLALYRAGRQVDALAVYRQTRELLRDELGLEPSRRLQELERSILEHEASLDAPARGNAPPRGLAPAVCPFKGLASFDLVDADYFCGRERLVSDLVARLVELTLVGILGPSGIGKSSLMRAGVLAELSAGALPGGANWRQRVLRPGEHPVAELRHVLGGDHVGQVLAGLSPGERIVIAVDQLEELFTQCKVEGERVAFLEQLVAAARDPARRALVVVALRADFYGRLAPYPRFAEILSASHVLVGPMDREDLARAIEEPTALAGLEIERALVEALVSDVAGQPGGLPLLSTMLLELWRTRDGRALRYDSYRTSGGVHRAVARLAETVYSQLGESERRIARSLMLRLAGGEDGALVRRRVPRAELERVDGAQRVLETLTDARLLTISDGEVEVSHEALLREWPRYRTWLEENRAERRLHAHLMTSAREWDAGGRDAGELYRGARLASALEWAARNDGELDALEREFIEASRIEAERQTRRLRGLLVGLGVLLIIAVVAGIVALIKQQTASNEARTALARQLGAEAVNVPRIDLAMLLAREAVNLNRSPQTEGTLLATLRRSPAVIGTFALPIESAPQELALSPDGRTLAVSDFRVSSFGYVQQGVSVGDVRLYDPRTHALQRSPLLDFAGVRPPTFSSDGALLAYPANAIAEPIAVRDAHTLALVSTLHLNPFQEGHQIPDMQRAIIAFAPDHRTLYAAYRAYSYAYKPIGVYLDCWSLPSGRRLSTIKIDPGVVLAMGLTDGGTHIAVVDARTISVLDAHTLHRMSSVAISPAPAAPSAAAISPDGHTVAIGSQAGAISFVDSQTGQARIRIGAHDNSVDSVVYAPDGRTVVTTGNDNRVILWDPRSASAKGVLTAPGAQVQGAVFSADAETLYTTSLGGVLLEWDLTGKRGFGQHSPVGARSPAPGPVSPLAPPLTLSPDGTTFAVRLGTSTVGLFSAQTLQRRATFTVKGGTITTLAWSPTAPELAVGGKSGLMQLWRVDGSPRLARVLTGLQPVLGKPEAIQAVAFSPDGRYVAASDINETVQSCCGIPYATHFDDRGAYLAIWRASAGQLLRSPADLALAPGKFTALTFSRDGTLLAASAPDGTVVILDPLTGRIRRTLQPFGADDTVSLAFAPDGTLATGTVDGFVQLWNPISGGELAGPLPVTAGPVTSISFDATGQRFATTGEQDGTVKLWFTSTFQQEGADLTTDQGSTSTAQFEPGRGSLLAVDDHGNAFTWPTSLGTWEQHACAVAGRDLTHAERARYLSGQSNTPVCP